MSQTFKIENGDIVYGVGGQPQMVTGKVKTSQDLGEAAQSPVDDVGFGFGIADLVGRVEDPDTVPALLSQKITSGIKRLMSLQENNQSLVRGDDEKIDSIASVQAASQGDSRTDFTFSFSVRTLALENVRKRGVVTNDS